MISLASVAGYLTSAAVAIKLIYGVMRSRSIENCVRECPNLYRTDPIARWNREDRFFIVIGALLLGLAWPLTMAVFVLATRAGRWLFGSPPLSPTESKIAHTALLKRNAELERELRIEDR